MKKRREQAQGTGSYLARATRRKPGNSLQASIRLEPSEFPTEVEAGAVEHAVVELMEADPRLEARVVARSTLTLMSRVPDVGPLAAPLVFKVDGSLVTTTLHKGMGAEEIAAAIEHGLPDGYTCAARDSSQSEVMIISVLRPAQVNPKTPELGFMATDPTQMFRWVAKNKLRIEGEASRGLTLRSFIELDLEGHRIRMPLVGGSSPVATALRLRDALPPRYSALLEVPAEPGGDATLTILRKR
jgi:hypothetical protein